MRRVLTTDLQALNYILTSPEFEKPPAGRQLLGDIAGKGWFHFFGGRQHLICIVVSGLLFVEGTIVTHILNMIGQ